MSFFLRIIRAARSLAGRGPVDRDLDADVGSYLAMLADEKRAAGMSEEQAMRQARIEMGGVEQVKEAVRAVRPAAWLDVFARDLRYGVRMLAKTPAFSVTAILVLALGIGANSAVFSLVNVFLFQPAPGADQPGEAIGIHTRDAETTDGYRPFSYSNYEAVRDSATVFEHVMAHAPIQVGLANGGTSRQVSWELTTGNYFAALGVRLAAGRTFSREEERPGSRAAVMILSHAYWVALGSPREIVGETIRVNSRPFAVIGVAPPGFTGRVPRAGPAFWMPLGADAMFAPPSADPSSLGLMVVARTKPGVTLEAANAAVGALSATQAPARNGVRQVLSTARLSRFGFGFQPAGSNDDPILFAFGALEVSALIVLVIASLNVANMQLARGSSRRREIAMRLALGAGRGRIVSQLMTEGLLLALTGGALGLAVSVWTFQAFLAWAVPALSSMMSAMLSIDGWPDWRVLLVSLACCTLSALIFSLGPSWTLSRLDLVSEMKGHERGGSNTGLRRFGTRNLLVAGQIALSLALLAVSGLFARGAALAATVEPGYSFDRQLLVRLDARAAGPDETAWREAYGRVIETVRTMPGVESAALASDVAFQPAGSRVVWHPGTVPGSGSRIARGPSASSFAVGAAYFRTLGLPMLRGREFTLREEQDASSTGVAIIDEPLASKLFPGRDPVGQFVHFSPDRRGDAPPLVQIVGVVPGLRHRLNDTGPVAHIYLPLGSRYQPGLNIHVRTAANGRSENDAVRAALGRAFQGDDSKPALLSIQSLDEARDSTDIAWLVRLAARAFGAFGLIAVLMATVGLYGVKAYLVTRRTREIGIRMAIGAGAGELVRMVLKEGAVLLVASIAFGFVLAVGAGQVVSRLLFGVRPFDPVVLGTASLLLGAAVLAACYLPARRATRISATTALRVE